MSHQSGIPVSDGLKDAFAAAGTDDSVRFLKVQIQEEEMVCVDTVAKSGDFLEDLDNTTAALDDDACCYILFKSDKENSQGKEWFLFSYVPDVVKVKEKMVYASSLATLKNSLGSYFFTDEIHATVKSDIDRSGYESHREMQEAEVPLTQEEYEKKQERESGAIYTGGSSTYIHGVSFPLADGVADAVSNFVGGSNNYLQLGVDTEKEVITLGDASNVDVDEVGAQFPTEVPAFHFYRWSHDHEGESLDSVVYIFSCPDGSGGTTPAPVKMRMLYSASKANIENVVTGQGVEIALKLEVNSGSEVTKDAINHEIHPPPVVEKKAFAKPRRPGAGGRRLIRNNQ